MSSARRCRAAHAEAQKTIAALALARCIFGSADEVADVARTPITIAVHSLCAGEPCAPPCAAHSPHPGGRSRDAVPPAGGRRRNAVRLPALFPSYRSRAWDLSL